VPVVLGRGSATLLGVSMVPRAEIALVVAERGLTTPGAGVEGVHFGAMLIVVLVTSTAFPLLIRRQLERTITLRAFASAPRGGEVAHD
jgi:hypothetical protein